MVELLYPESMGILWAGVGGQQKEFGIAKVEDAQHPQPVQTIVGRVDHFSKP